MTRALPLQLLLLLALVLNGIGGAMAGVQALRAPATGVPVEMASGCAHHEAATPAAEAASLPGAPAEDPDPGCRDTLECRQACLHGAAAVPAQAPLARAWAGAPAPLPPLRDGHAAPEPDGPIRPPIRG